MSSSENIKRDAKDLAFLFFNSFSIKYNNSIIAKTLIQVKALLELGYTREDIANTIEYLAERKQDIYSFGYINKTIDQHVHKANYEKQKKNFVKQEVKLDIESTVSNKDKATSYKMPSWVDTDMFGG